MRRVRVRRASLALGVALVPLGWAFAAAPLGMVGHMAGHMIAVAVAAPFLAYGIAGSRWDPAERWPAVVTPLQPGPSSVLAGLGGIAARGDRASAHRAHARGLPQPAFRGPG